MTDKIPIQSTKDLSFIIDVSYGVILVAAVRIVEQTAKIEGRWLGADGCLYFVPPPHNSNLANEGFASIDQLRAFHVRDWLIELANKEEK